MIRHQGTVELHTPRLLLRRFTIGDAPDMFANWCNDDVVTRYMTWPAHADVEVTRGILANWLENYAKEDYYHWGIVLKGPIPRLIGSIGVTIQNMSAQWMEVGYCLGRPWWRQGIMAEAFAEVIRFLFEQVGVNRIQATHDTNNAHSGAVMRKCGLRLEGIMRQQGRNNQGIVDEAMYAILAEDYFGVIAARSCAG